MNIIKRTSLTVFVLLILGVLFRGWLYRQLVTYRSVGHRTNDSVTNNRFVDYLNQSVKRQSDPDIEQIITRALSLTSKQLSFVAESNDVDPNKLVSSRKANCMGYASFYAATCNYLLEKHQLSDTWIAKPQVGQLYFIGINVHNYFEAPFFKDHDFVTIENILTGETIAVDPTVHDYLYIDFVTYARK